MPEEIRRTVLHGRLERPGRRQRRGGMRQRRAAERLGVHPAGVAPVPVGVPVPHQPQSRAEQAAGSVGGKAGRRRDGRGSVGARRGDSLAGDGGGRLRDRDDNRGDRAVPVRRIETEPGDLRQTLLVYVPGEEDREGRGTVGERGVLCTAPHEKETKSNAHKGGIDMRDDRFLRALGDIDDSYVDGALEDIRPAPARPVKRIVVLAACVAAVAATLAIMIPAMMKGRGTTPPTGTSAQSGTETLIETSPGYIPNVRSDVFPGDFKNEPDKTDFDPRPTGGSDTCKIHPYFCYHWFPKTMIEIVGEDQFNEWMESAEKVTPTSDCRYPEANVYAFIRHFNIPRIEFEEQYYHSSLYYSTVLNFDVLYDDSQESADEYYRNVDYLNGVYEKRKALSYLKVLIRESDPDLWIETFGNNLITPQASVKAAVDAFGLSREDIEHIIEESSKTIDAVYDYNIDALFDGSMDGLTPVEQDALFCGISDPMME